MCSKCQSENKVKNGVLKGKQRFKCKSCTKAETFTIEGFNSLIRHYLARFRRKTKCYTKSLEMMILSLKLLMAKRDNILSMKIY